MSAIARRGFLGAALLAALTAGGRPLGAAVPQASGAAPPEAEARPGAAAPAEAAEDPPADGAGSSLEDLVVLDLKEDAERRMSVPVRLEEKGPFHFLVDTASERSVVSEELARALGLAPAGSVTVAGFAGVQTRPIALVRRLDVGGRRLADLRLPLLPRRHIGALGILGLDGLNRQSIGIDFHARSMELRAGKGFVAEPGAVVVRGKSKFGQLILVDSSAKATPLYVVLDTGAQDTMGNPALRRLLYDRRQGMGEADPRRQVKLVSVTGQSIMGESDLMPELRLGNIGMKNVPLVYAELETFRRFGLTDKPAMMLGMDTLRAFAFISIDFARHEIGFTLPNGVSTLA